MLNIPQDLIAGDILLCAGEEIVRRFTNSNAGHVAIYIGLVDSTPSVITSLRGTGVNVYSLEEGAPYIVSVRRPSWTFNLKNALTSFNTNYKGKPYGWGDCANDVGLPDWGNGWNCSHTSSQLLEDGGSPQFDLLFPKAKITPRDLQTTILAATIPLN